MVGVCQAGFLRLHVYGSLCYLLRLSLTNGFNMGFMMVKEFDFGSMNGVGSIFLSINFLTSICLTGERECLCC